VLVFAALCSLLFRLAASYFSLLVQREVTKRKQPLRRADAVASVPCAARAQGDAPELAAYSGSDMRGLPYPLGAALLSACEGMDGYRHIKSHIKSHVKSHVKSSKGLAFPDSC
jgi:hypothetical protein